MKSDVSQFKTSKGAMVAYVLVAIGILTFVPSYLAKAEDPIVSIQPPAENVSSVQSPGIPYVTSNVDDFNIIWQWTAPEGGLTPGAVPDPENPDAPVAEQPSDIVFYGYEFLKQGAVLTRGTVPSTQNTITTPVTSKGEYVLRVWSITREEATSVVAEGAVTIVSVVDVPLPPIDEEIIPAPIDTSSVIKKQASGQTATSQTAPLSTNRSQAVPKQQVADPSVLSAQAQNQPVVPIDTTAAVKPSSQGWMILGVAWYIWLLIIAGIFAAGRGIYAYVQAR